MNDLKTFFFLSLNSLDFPFQIQEKQTAQAKFCFTYMGKRETKQFNWTAKFFFPFLPFEIESDWKGLIAKIWGM